jgi:ABC-type transporter Mla subunit MlaD
MALAGCDKGYDVMVQFHDTSGVEPGMPVKANGVVVGKVVDKQLTPNHFARFTMHLSPQLELWSNGKATLRSGYIELDTGTPEQQVPGGKTIANRLLRSCLDPNCAQLPNGTE